MARKASSTWDAQGIRALRQRLGLSQAAMASQLGTRQQTVSEWEVGLYEPRGTSVAMLNILAERAETEYGTPAPKTGKGRGRGKA